MPMTLFLFCCPILVWIINELSIKNGFSLERLQVCALMWSGSNAHLFCPLDTAYVRVFVTDVNDNAPAFSQPVYEISVEEDKEVGFVVITVTANDEDEGTFFSLRVGVSNILFWWSCHFTLVLVFCCFSFVCLCTDFYLTAHWYIWQRWRRRGCKNKLSEINLGGKFAPFCAELVSKSLWWMWV